MTAAVSPPKKFGMVTLSVVKSAPPPMRLTSGMMMSLTSEVTMAEKAAPITTPTARSITLPWLIKVLNSLIKLFSLSFFIMSKLY